MRNKILMVCITAILVAAAGYPDARADGEKVRVVVFPFNNLSSETIDLRVPALLNAALSKEEHIETVPAEVIRRDVLNVEPAFLWTGRKGARDTGGIVWKIEPAVVEKVARKTFSDYTVYGDISSFGTKWAVNAYLTGLRDNGIKAFSMSADTEEELPVILRRLAGEITEFIKKETVVDGAGEEVRKFLGGIYSLPVIVSKIDGLSQTYPDVLPLKAALLDLYLRDKAAYKGKILDLALEIMSMYDPANGNDTRYLLSLSLDPFEVAANIYEENKEWRKAINVRLKALQVFSFDADRHRAGIKAAGEELKRQQADK